MKIKHGNFILLIILFIALSCSKKTTESDRCATPSFNPPGGNYTYAQNVSITCATINSTIYYTIDGSNPNSNSPIYAGYITVPTHSITTIKAQAYRDGWKDSVISTATYNITGTVSDPYFYPAGGVYNTNQSVTIHCTTNGATIRYTTDGTEPTNASAIYSSPIIVIAPNLTTIKAKAFKSDWNDSGVTSSTYSFKVANPVFSPNGGIFLTNQNITISCSTDNASIRYTTDNTEPTITSTLYVAPINLVAQSTITFKAKAFKPNWNDSDVVTETYSFKVKNPVFTPPGGTYSIGQAISISCDTDSASIRYTTDNNEPNITSLLYVTPIILGGQPTLTFKAKAFKPNWNDSDVVTETYSFKVKNPVFTPPGGTYSTGQTISITCETNGALIYYTTNNNEPDQSSIPYVSPFYMQYSNTLKARAYKTGYFSSDVETAIYIFTP